MPLFAMRRQERFSAKRLACLALGSFAFLTLSDLVARADDASPTVDLGGRYTVVEENDYFFYPTDHYYTQGIYFSYLTPAVKDDDFTAPAFAWLDDNAFASDGKPSRHMDWAFGQSLFTPDNLVLGNPNPKDRPYAAWAYLQGGFVQNSTPEEGRGVSRLDDLEIQLGVVGPQAFGEETQNDWHEYFMHQAVSNGWGYQLHDEPGLNIIYDRHWRYDLANTSDDGKGFGIDVVPDLGGSAGNVLTYANAGVTLRLGYQLNSDYGPPRIQPSPSGGDYFDNSVSGLGGYLFVTGEGRGMARNIFIQGNTFQSSRGVSMAPAVGDFVFGGTLFWGQWLRATVSLDNRSREFYGQPEPDRFTSLSLSANFAW
ncbi:MAG TPA: lipid A deacylase LpxR family protein [Magnetospirillaceae bacterium]|jgi:hypothetical protein